MASNRPRREPKSPKWFDDEVFPSLGSGRKTKKAASPNSQPNHSNGTRDSNHSPIKDWLQRIPIPGTPPSRTSPKASTRMNDQEVINLPRNIHPAQSVHDYRREREPSQSPALPVFKFEEIPLESKFQAKREDTPDDGTGNYLTHVNYDDPTQPDRPELVEDYDIPTKHSMIRFLFHRLGSNRSTLGERIKLADRRWRLMQFAQMFSKYEKTLDTLAHELCVIHSRNQNCKSYDDIQQDIMNWGIRVSADQGRQAFQILDGIAQLEWQIVDFGKDISCFVGGESLRFGQRCMRNMDRRARITLMTLGNQEKMDVQYESFNEDERFVFGPTIGSVPNPPMMEDKELDYLLDSFYGDEQLDQ